MEFSIPIGPRVRRSPFFDATVADGVSHFSVYNHMYMPTSYGKSAGRIRPAHQRCRHVGCSC